MSSITGIAITELGEAVVTFGAIIPNIKALSNGQNWDILDQTTATPVASSVYDAEVLIGALSVKVWFNVPLLPSSSYTIIASVKEQEWYQSGNLIEQVADNFTSPTVSVNLNKEWQHGILRAISRAAGQLIQQATGRPQTILLQSIRPDDQHMFVESTLGFPSFGYVFIGDIEYYYKTKTAASFRNIVPSYPTTLIQSANQIVVLNQTKILPPDSRFFLKASGDGTNGIL